MDQAPQIKTKFDINIVRNFILKMRLFGAIYANELMSPNAVSPTDSVLAYACVRRAANDGCNHV